MSLGEHAAEASRLTREVIRLATRKPISPATSTETTSAVSRCPASALSADWTSSGRSEIDSSTPATPLSLTTSTATIVRSLGRSELT